MISKIKEIELIFRSLVNDANNGAPISSRIPYKSLSLPSEKIIKLCSQVIKDNQNKVEKINVSLFEELIELSQETMNFIRMSKLTTEKESLKVQEEEEKEDVDIQRNYDYSDTRTDEEIEEK